MEDQRSDEQKAFDQVNQIIEILLDTNSETRHRIYQTVGAFFGYESVIRTPQLERDRRTPSRA